MPVRDTYCSFCGAKFIDGLTGYPRTCGACGTTIWANPIPVSVVLVPVVSDGKTGVLVVRRAIEPRVGMLAIAGGFLEAHETWQEGGAREIREESGLAIDPATIQPLWFASSYPNHNRVLLFGVAAPIPAAALPPFASNAESTERGLVFGPDGLDEVFAFPLHVEAARRYFAANGVTGPHAFRAA